MPPNADYTGGHDGPIPPPVELVWREDEGVSLKVPRFYPTSDRVLQKVSTRTDVPKVITMAEVAKHAKRDDLWVIVDGKAYDVTAFVENHPGGWLPMVNMGGKDCTDVFANYHPARVYKTMLPQYFLGDVADYTESAFVKGHRQLRQQLLAEGMFETLPHYYPGLYCWLGTLWVSAVYLMAGCGGLGCHLAGAAVLALFWQQMAFVGHDCGHNSVTHKWQHDTTLGLLVGNLTTGIGMGWWKRSHNVHHVCCNSVEHDPDIQHMPIFAVDQKIFDRGKPFWSSFHAKWVEMDLVAKALVPHQHWLFYPVMAFARFNLYVQSWILLLSKEHVHNKGLEVAGLLGFAAWYCLLVGWLMPASHGLPERVAVVLLSHWLAGTLHVQICLSHFAQDTYHGHAYNGDQDEWFRMQVATTLNVDCPWWQDWFHGGLQFQVEHHLWPRLPRHNLRRAQVLVKQFCKEYEVEYRNLPWIEAQVQLIKKLKDTAMAARKFNEQPAASTASPAADAASKQTTAPGTRGVEGGGTTIFDCLDAATNG